MLSKDPYFWKLATVVVVLLGTLNVVSSLTCYSCSSLKEGDECMHPVKKFEVECGSSSAGSEEATTAAPQPDAASAQWMCVVVETEKEFYRACSVDNCALIIEKRALLGDKVNACLNCNTTLCNDDTPTPLSLPEEQELPEEPITTKKPPSISSFSEPRASFFQHLTLSVLLLILSIKNLYY